MTIPQKKNVYLFQPNDDHGYLDHPKYWIPYSSGCIWSYVAQFPDITDQFQLKRLFFQRLNPSLVMDQIDSPTLCGFSAYVWNVNYCLHMAELIKQRWPDCVIVFGGPSTSGKMLKHAFIDTVVISEGEENFLAILRTIANGQQPDTIYQKRRIESLDIPSPYLTGVFDQIIRENPTARWSVTFETNRGCPYSCTFCDWGGMTYSKVKKFDLDKVRAEIEWMGRNPVNTIWCADANVGIFKDRDLEIAKMLREVSNRDSSVISDITFQFAKNSNEVVFQIAQALGPYGQGVTLSLQSLHQPTLEAIKRTNMKSQDIKEMLALSEKYQVATSTEIILGLPMETLDSWKQGFSKILEMGNHGHIDVWPASLLENAELNSPETRQKYNLKSVTLRKIKQPGVHNQDTGRQDVIEENSDIVCSTSTMTTDDIVEGQMYAWMFQHIHSPGYSQIISKFLRHVHGISYREFYDALFKKLLEPGSFDNYLTDYGNFARYRIDETYNPKVPPKVLPVWATGKHILANKTALLSMLVDIANNLAGDIPDSVVALQKNYVYDPDQVYPITMELDYDPVTWAPKKHTVEITPRTEVTPHNYGRHRQGLLKNTIKDVDCKLPSQ
jgi:tRNA A37 methylthiotransferase MiaB